MFKKTYTLIDSKYKTPDKADEPNIPAGLWRKCNKCGQPIYAEDVRSNFYICPKCKGYFRVHAYRRIEMTADAGSFEEWDKEMEFANPLDCPGYEKKIEAAREKTKLNEAIVTGKCTIGGEPAVIGVCDARFIMSSMGHVVGEKIARAVERATKEQLPVVIFACSGGARMQEGKRIPDADGKDLRGFKAPSQGRTAVCQRSDRSDHRRRDGQLCHAGRYHSGRTGRINRLRRPQSHRADHRTEAAGGIPAF